MKAIVVQRQPDAPGWVVREVGAEKARHVLAPESRRRAASPLKLLPDARKPGGSRLDTTIERLDAIGVEGPAVERCKRSAHDQHNLADEGQARLVRREALARRPVWSGDLPLAAQARCTSSRLSAFRGTHPTVGRRAPSSRSPGHRDRPSPAARASVRRSSFPQHVPPSA